MPYYAHSSLIRRGKNKYFIQFRTICVCSIRLLGIIDIFKLNKTNSDTYVKMEMLMQNLHVVVMTQRQNKTNN